MKTIGIDVNALTRPNRTGVELYVFELIRTMMKSSLRPDEQVILYASEVVDDLGVLPEGWSWRIIRWPLGKGWTHGRLSLELFFRTPDVFFSPGHEVPLLTGRTKIVSTVHDLAFLRRADLYPTTGNYRQHWAIKNNIRRADRLLAISQVTRQDLIELLSVDGERIDVALLARPSESQQGATCDVLEAYDLIPKQYFVSIGRLEKKKNSQFLIRAFSAWKQKTGKPHKLVLAGTWGWGREEIEQKIAISHAKNDIVLTGYLPEADKPALLTQATAYCFPSCYEGFGLPALDAFYYRIPLIASDLPIFHEVAGDAAYFADAEDVSAWIEALDLAVAGDLDALIQKGVERNKVFTWEQTASATWLSLRKCYA